MDSRTEAEVAVSYSGTLCNLLYSLSSLLLQGLHVLEAGAMQGILASFRTVDELALEDVFQG